MDTPFDICIDDYDYSLPEERIPKYPLNERDTSRLLVYENGLISESVFNRLPDYIPSGTLLFFNNTKVIHARLHFFKDTGAKIEIFCLEPFSPSEYESVFQQTEKCTWVCLVGNLKKWKEGKLSQALSVNGKEIALVAELKEKHEDSFLIEFSWNNPSVTFADILENAGELPIPPYLNRKTEKTDLNTYQTVYSKIKGSVAAPTAGLHFTEHVFRELDKKNVLREELTLHVGAGTFRPVKTKTIGEHAMHTELFTVKKESVEKLLSHSGNVIAVGTTSVRTLESLYYIGMLLETNPDTTVFSVEQWIPYLSGETLFSRKKALENILSYLNKNNKSRLTASTRIMIVPGYDFKIVDGMITNFHQPKSTLLLLVSAFLKGNWKKVYEYALAHDFRFLSYGDSSLLWKE
ncbi:MAG: S-adenosylmethionine:tRNA ribosyltransferase-isomerase [Candidatus Azobacteroides sp.]|nr:S-adenosylmethionine:tRNA ribosyltransferase-isomerase [Candidatus Azobacteroides sp.]